MSNSTIDTDINAFVTTQNQNRGQNLPGGGTLSLDYNALTGTVPTGGNAVTGIAGIVAGAATLLPAGQNGNAVIIDGAISTSASTSGADSYSLLVDTSGQVTLTDNNTGNSETITGASYLIFDGGATTPKGAYQSAYFIETGLAAQMASMYNAAYNRVPDLAGLEFYIDQYGTIALPDLHAMAFDFLGSPEFKADWPTLQTTPDDGGVNDRAYINALYGQILHRTPSATEIQFYVNALQGTLTDSSGHPIAAADRSQLLVYFSLSPENQSDIAASKGGWLINPGDGALGLGAMTTASATAVLTSDIASGTVSGNDFANLSAPNQISVTLHPSSGMVSTTINVDASGVYSNITTTIPNETINLSSKYIMGEIDGDGDTINGVPTGGSIILLSSTYPFSNFANHTGTVNLFGNVNWIDLGGSYAATVAAIVNGWNSTDIIIGPNSSTPTSSNPPASLLANADGLVLQGSVSNPINGTSPVLAGTSSQVGEFFIDRIAINVGSIANDSVSAIVAAAAQVYKVGDVTGENAFFFGQDPQGNTMVWYWRGDTAHTGSIQATDITGGIELVGVQASSLTSANFHH